MTLSRTSTPKREANPINSEPTTTRRTENEPAQPGKSLPYRPAEGTREKRRSPPRIDDTNPHVRVTVVDFWVSARPGYIPDETREEAMMTGALTNDAVTPAQVREFAPRTSVPSDHLSDDVGMQEGSRDIGMSSRLASRAKADVSQLGQDGMEALNALYEFAVEDGLGMPAQSNLLESLSEDGHRVWEDGPRLY